MLKKKKKKSLENTSPFEREFLSEKNLTQSGSPVFLVFTDTGATESKGERGSVLLYIKNTVL